MLRYIVTASLLCTGALAADRPMIIRDAQRIDPPSANYDSFANVLGLDRDHAIISATRFDQCCSAPQTNYALLYRHDGTQWNYQRVLYADRNETSLGSQVFVAMNNGLVALDMGPLVTMRRSGETYTQFPNPFPGTLGSGSWAPGGFVKWSGNTLFVARRLCEYGQWTWGGATSTVNADNTWSTPLAVQSDDTQCEHFPETFDFQGDSIVTTGYALDALSSSTHVLRRTGSTWSESWRLPYGRGGGVGVRLDEVFVPNREYNQTQVYRNDGSLAIIDNLRTVRGDPGAPYVLSSNYVFAGGNVFRKDANGRYEHVAVLAVRDGGATFGEVSLSGRRLLINGQRNTNNPVAYAFDLPTSFTPSVAQQFSFESGTTGAWNVTDGEFAIATRGTNRVFRQSSTAGDARAILTTYDWDDQGIDADIRPTAFAGADLWAGLAVRYVDADNHYYVTLRNSGVLELRRKVNGVVTGMGSVALPVTAGSNYRIGLTARGGGISVSVNGDWVLYNEDESLTHGRAALLAWRTQVDFDNVVVSELGPEQIYDARQQCQGNLDADLEWTLSGTGQWDCLDNGAPWQRSTNGDARAVVGTEMGDQIVQTRVRAAAFAPPTGTQERWFGLAARYRDSANYYYATVRSGNTVSLRKQVNGVITVLGSAPLNVAAGTWYDLRLDAVGTELRVLVNGNQVIQANDASHARGQSGAITFKTAAEYERLLSWRP